MKLTDSPFNFFLCFQVWCWHWKSSSSGFAGCVNNNGGSGWSLSSSSSTPAPSLSSTTTNQSGWQSFFVSFLCYFSPISTMFAISKYVQLKFWWNNKKTPNIWQRKNSCVKTVDLRVIYNWFYTERKMQGTNARKVISEVHFLYCSVVSLGGKVNTRRMSQAWHGIHFYKIINEIFWS